MAWLNGTGDSQIVVPLGSMNFSPVTTSGATRRATIDQTTTFLIEDSVAFGEFTGAMITQPNFTWRLTSDNLRVNALKFPVATGLSFSKDTTLNGTLFSTSSLCQY